MKILTSGRTAVDRAVVALAGQLGLAVGGQIGRDPPAYRILRNVSESDATIWFGDMDCREGQAVLAAVREAGKPLLLNPGIGELTRWLKYRRLDVLHVTGDQKAAGRAGRVLEDTICQTHLIYSTR